MSRDNGHSLKFVPIKQRRQFWRNALSLVFTAGKIADELLFCIYSILPSRVIDNGWYQWTRKFKQWWSTIPSISTKRTSTCHLTWLKIKRPRVLNMVLIFISLFLTLLLYYSPLQGKWSVFYILYQIKCTQVTIPAWSTIPSISTKRTSTCHLTWLKIKRPRVHSVHGYQHLEQLYTINTE
jgi:hypothetical protein